MITLTNVSKILGGKIVFENFSFEFKDGRKYFIKGPSGCGKTTLLRLISGIEKPDSGIIFNKNTTFSYCFQEPRLFPIMNALSNAALLSTKEHAAELLLALDIDKSDFSKKPKQLSVGMQRRVALARSLSIHADAYLFDEPFAGLDNERIVLTVELIKKITENKTVIIVSHDETVISDYITDMVLL